MNYNQRNSFMLKACWNPNGDSDDTLAAFNDTPAGVSGHRPTTYAGATGPASVPVILRGNSQLSSIMTVHAHFDGKVIIPDKPLDLPLNQALVVQIEPIHQTCEPAEESVLSWLTAHASESAALPADLADQHDRHLSDSVIQDR